MNVLATPLCPFTVSSRASMPRSRQLSQKKRPTSSSATQPTKPGRAPMLASASMAFPALPPVALAGFSPFMRSESSRCCSSSISTIPPLGSVRSSSICSLSSRTSTSTSALPIPIILSIITVFSCKDKPISLLFEKDSDIFLILFCIFEISFYLCRRKYKEPASVAQLVRAPDC